MSRSRFAVSAWSPAKWKLSSENSPACAIAAVIAAQSGNNTRLIAYFTGDEGMAIEALRTGMSSALPDYMVPAAFVRLETLPLTANGKLDRKALPAPGHDALVTRPFEAPAGETEGKDGRALGCSAETGPRRPSR